MTTRTAEAAITDNNDEVAVTSAGSLTAAHHVRIIYDDTQPPSDIINAIAKATEAVRRDLD